MTITQQIAALRKEYRKGELKKFRAWVRKEFGRTLKPGDILVSDKKDIPYGYMRPRAARYKVIKHMWDYSTPALCVEIVAEGNQGCWLKGATPLFGKGKLRELTLTSGS